MAPGSWPRRGLVAAAGAALAASLAVAVAPVGAAPAAGAAAPVDWAPCPTFAGFDCASYPVPLDHADPDGPTVRLALIRRPAEDQAAKVGSLFVNPGGPGEPGLAFARGAVANLADAETRRTFDIVGFDPRGVGESSPIECFGTIEEFVATLDPALEVPIGAAEVGATLAAYRAYTDACAARGGPLLPHVSTLNVARDLDLLRQAVGDEQLTFAGYSYGTLIGATYANLYPDRVRALVLDGMVDPVGRTRLSLVNELERAGGFETALKAFLAACAASGPGCAFSADDPAAKWVAIRERLRSGPATLAGAPVTISSITNYVAGQLYRPSQFRTTAGVLQTLYLELFPLPAEPAPVPAPQAAARAAAPSAADDADDAALPSAGEVAAELATAGRFGALSDAYPGNFFDALYAVNCLDKRLPRDQRAYPLTAAGFEAVHRTFGRWQAFSASVCATWPATGERYAGPWNRPTANPLLVVGVEYDPATPYVFAQRGVRQLADARLLTLAGFGHTSTRSPSTCLREKVNAYLQRGELPAEGTVCQPNAPPFPAPPGG